MEECGDLSAAEFRERLRVAACWVAGEETERPNFGGSLLRPRFALDLVPAAERCQLPDRFWLAALAVQFAHEASLLHDDVVDGAGVRRGESTVVASHGVAAALLGGDQLLTRAYRAAAVTGSMPFAEAFAEAVDETVRGERAQHESQEDALDPEALDGILGAKSGSLFAVALSSWALLCGSPAASVHVELGRRVGIFYQKVDDLRDFCTGARSGKAPLADYRRGLWTWPRAYMPAGAPPETLFRSRSSGPPPVCDALRDLEGEGRGLVSSLEGLVPHAQEVRREVRRWLQRLRRDVEAEVTMVQGNGENRPAGVPPSGSVQVPNRLADGGPTRPSFSGDSDLLEEQDPMEVLSHHGRSFRFASRFMPTEALGRAARIYHFCRLVDDTVDRASDPARAADDLASLLERARSAYRGEARSDPDGVIGRTMQEMKEDDIPFGLVEELVAGVRMDLGPVRFSSWEELDVYTHRVAGVVGLWIAGAGGVRDAWAQERAAEMGRSMQLTNIARDVGEDLRLGRLYLPLDLLARHGLDEAGLQEAARDQRPVPPTYAAVLEEVMGRADAGYGTSFQALPHLPRDFRRAMAVAARVYQGIHDEIRKDGYDTLRKRARTGRLRKGRLAVAALRELRLATTRFP